MSQYQEFEVVKLATLTLSNVSIAIYRCINLLSCSVLITKPKRVDLGKIADIARQGRIRVNSTNRTGWFADTAIGTCSRLYVTHTIFIFEKDAVDRADFNTGLVHHVNAGTCYHIGHLLRPQNILGSLI